MKAWNGFFELVLVAVFIMAGIPLLMSLLYAMNRSKFNYLDDKTIYSISSVQDDMYLDETNGMLYPSAMLPIHTDFGGALALALIQDDYCPDQAKQVAWSYGNQEPNVALQRLTKWDEYEGTDQYTGSEENIGVNPNAEELANFEYGRLVIHDGWQGIKTDRYYKIKSEVAYGRLPTLLGGNDKPLYLVYNYRSHVWMLTAKKVSVFK